MPKITPAVIIVIAMLIAALFAFDSYEYDGRYRAAGWDSARQQIEKVESWWGKDNR
jgi:hypothetical protein